MPHSDRDKLRAVFDEAAELDAAARSRFVADACGGDPALRAEVLSLLAALDQGGEALEADAAGLLQPEESDGASPAAAGAVIGGFRIVRLLGRGAMGAVYEAEQDHPRRRVALKVLQAWSATREARRRLIDEADILGRLQHPGIARVIAAGSHEFDLRGADAGVIHGLFGEAAGVPWIAMDLVENARTIIDHARERALSVPDRLRLFAQVCDAVHHGHTQGVIHRDLKPANVLVDGAGQSRVIDFGVARALGDRGGQTLATLHTLEGSLVGTLRYMSPEQCDGRAAHADTRSDVYSLGVVLYELLVGESPYTLPEDSISAAARVVCETPPRPPREACPGLGRDLETILLHAIDKDPGRRYQSAAELAAELRRVLAHEPILARPTTLAYRATKFAQRRPALTALTLAVIAACIALVAAIGVGLSREYRARVEADRQARLANLIAAEAAVRLGDGGAARQRLDAVPERLRGWEWGYLSAAADTSLEQWQPGADETRAGTYPSPDGQHVIIQRVSGEIEGWSWAARSRVWSTRTVKPLGALRFNADGSRVIVPGDGACTIHDTATGTELFSLAPFENTRYLGAAYDPLGRWVALTTIDPQRVAVCDLRSREIAFKSPATGWVFHPDFSPDGSRLAWSDATEAVIVDTATWSTQSRQPTRRPTRVEPGTVLFTPDGRSLAVAVGKDLDVLDVASERPRRELAGAAQRLPSMALIDSGRYLAAGSVDKSVYVWDLSSGAIAARLCGHAQPVHSVVALHAPEHPGEFLTADAAGWVRRWRVGAGEPRGSVRTEPGARFVDAAVFVDAGRALLLSSHAGPIQHWTLGEPAPRTLGSAADTGFAWSAPDDGTLFVGCEFAGPAFVFDVALGRRRWSVPNADPDAKFVCSAISVEHGLVALGDGAGVLRLFGLADGEPRGQVRIPEAVRPNRFARMSFAPGRPRLGVGLENGVVQLHDLDSLGRFTEIAPVTHRIGVLAFNRNGSRMAFPDGLGHITIIDTDTKRVVRTLGGVDSTVWSLSFSPDGDRLAVGAQDRVTHVFDVSTGDEVLQLRDHTGSVISLAWSPDGRFLASGAFDRLVFVYDGERKRDRSAAD